MGLIIILFPDALLLFTLENSFNHYNNRCIYLRALWGGGVPHLSPTSLSPTDYQDLASHLPFLITVGIV